jgi:ABC-type Co2+ transport system permease subunit
MASDLGTLIVAALCWCAFAYKLRHLRRRASDPCSAPLRALVWVLGQSAALATLTPKMVGAVLDGLLAISGATRLVANILSMGTCLAIVAWLFYLSLSERDARAHLTAHVRVFTVVLAVVLVLFALHHPPLTADREFAGAYNYVFLLYVTYAVTSQIRICWRFASVVDAPLLRLGLRIVSVSNVLGLVTISVALGYLLDADLDLDLPGSAKLFIPMYAVSSVLFVIGMTLPAWGPRVGLEAFWWTISRRRAMRRLGLLWSVVTEAYPGVVLDRTLLAVSSHGERLAAERMPVEIHDGWLHLRYYLTAQDIDKVCQLADQQRVGNHDRDALLTAAYVMLAVRRKSNGADPAVVVAPLGSLGAGSDTLLADVRFLCDVSKRLQAPFVRDAVLRLV